MSLARIAGLVYVITFVSGTLALLAMWVAAGSFFWGPPNRVPEIIRIPALLPIPVLTPIVAMLYWWHARQEGGARHRHVAAHRLVDRTAEVMS